MAWTLPGAIVLIAALFAPGGARRNDDAGGR
jgi:hypothetical protein